MKEPIHRPRRAPRGALLLIALLLGVVVLVNWPSELVGQLDGVDPAAGEEFVELAPYMTNLQTLTHKLALSIEHSNHQLAEFYLYESLEAMEDIKTEVPEYRGLPVALYADQIAAPAYEALGEAIKKDSKAPERTNKRSSAAFGALIGTCNQCHAVTKHEFIRIPAASGGNPFLQDFKPLEE